MGPRYGFHKGYGINGGVLWNPKVLKEKCKEEGRAAALREAAAMAARAAAMASAAAAATDMRGSCG